ncbi:hypothetical protein J433_00565 [Corynebacterium glutamicum MT]|uniref:Uncharacterized protein n=2 Tax=Corynebacterium glutamicum TaxID=1718 RepID=A0AB36I5M1_CORGT|nr:hypothetical protein [Corynebacterium glutamicum]AGN18553.1 hypothetical protein C624_04830 [Corynebacterium glutamicum SCgG1]AGN21576.1 hypothetical protein C629_04830 [Corynebacterium glutamicum SCgG2]EGV39379.1 hypothetical protein CgS9114_12971 [Corynebacterium glutamicum S9114]EOA66191.1 hypothetical protein J433_00565 [Corynebacterium glutamicum MT]EPP41462.1 hypothetical protein A583_04336 [Corynebacterium glutamicum Z188]
MPANYTAGDALTHTRESLKNTLDWVHEHLAAHYGLEWIDGEKNLPEPLNEVMTALYSITDDVTDMAVDTGVYHRNSDGVLMRPVYYSNHRPVYLQRMIGPVGDQNECTYLGHPNGQPYPVVEAETRRAGLHVVQGGGRNE